MRTRLIHSVLLCAGTCLIALPQGCNSRPSLRPETAQAIYEISMANQEREDAQEESFASMDWSLGQIPSNGRILPLNSPDGQWIAVQIGPDVTNASLLGLPDAPPATDNTVEIWKLDLAASSVVKHGTLPEPLILGRSADQEGFLVESPRSGGSRWIGKVKWTTGEIDWIVQDNNVNTFGSLGPEGELAWCTRTLKERHFALAVRFANGEELGIGPNGGEWLMPSWSTRSSRLSVFFLADDGVLSLLSLDAQTPRLLSESPQRFDLMTGSTRQDVLRARSGQPVIQGTPAPPIEEVIFFHPVTESIYVWLPTNLLKNPPFPLSKDSIVATKDPLSAGYLVGTSGDLRWQDPDDRLGFVRVRYGTTIPRITTSRVAPYLLIIPGSGEVEIRAMMKQTPGASAPASLANTTAG
ncbi:MAG: hypothetical protein CMJ29_05130 [Phycisphaerae bacterium]|nr:hypothetical protein [Phycisphaerae bacterium]